MSLLRICLANNGEKDVGPVVELSLGSYAGMKFHQKQKKKSVSASGSSILSLRNRSIGKEDFNKDLFLVVYY